MKKYSKKFFKEIFKVKTLTRKKSDFFPSRCLYLENFFEKFLTCTWKWPRRGHHCFHSFYCKKKKKKKKLHSTSVTLRRFGVRKYIFQNIKYHFYCKSLIALWAFVRRRKIWACAHKFALQCISRINNKLACTQPITMRLFSQSYHNLGNCRATR